MISNIFAWFSKNLGIKLLALLLALVVYVHVYTEQEREWDLRVPLKVVGLSHDLVLETDLPSSAEIAVRGKGKQLLMLRYREPQALVDLSEVHPGTIQRMLSPTDVALPVGSQVNVTGILSPRMLSLTVDTLVTREAEVRVTVLGDLPEGLALTGPIRPVPARVQVTGPSRVVRDVETVSTEALRLDDVHGSSGFELAVRTELPHVTVEPPTVRVDLSLMETVRRTFEAVPVLLSGLGRGLLAHLEPDSAAITVSGPPGAVDSLAVGKLVVRLDAAHLSPGRHLLSPEVDLPEPGLRLKSVDPARFLVEVVRQHR
jgi:YbbR domain-containing protein